MISLKLIDPISKIEQDINTELVRQYNVLLAKKSSLIQRQLKSAARNWIGSQPEISSLKAESSVGSLNSVFGIRLGTSDSIVNAIIESVVSSTEIKLTKLDKKFRGGLEFNFQPSDFRNLLSLREGHVITQKNSDLHWLNWLLTEGDAVVVVGYSYTPSSDGRSGGGTMSFGGSFRVPPSFSGTINNNFITRAFSNREEELTKIISRVLS